MMTLKKTTDDSIINNFNSNIMEEYKEILREYFSRYKSQNKYYTAIKHHQAMYLLRKGVRSSEVARILNIDHSTVHYYKDKYKKFDWADDFVHENLRRYLEQSIYPCSSKNLGVKEKHIYSAANKVIDLPKRKYNITNKGFKLPQKYVDICEVFGMHKKDRSERMIYNRNYLILFLRLECGATDRSLSNLFNVNVSNIRRAIDISMQMIASVDQKFYRYNEQLRYILHGTTATGKIFLWSQGKASAPSSDEVQNDKTSIRRTA